MGSIDGEDDVFCAETRDAGGAVRNDSDSRSRESATPES
jgi:hypothetical protein